MPLPVTLGPTLRAAAFLARLRSPGRAGPAAVSRPVGEVPCDWYEPRGRPSARVVALHGVTVNGKDDHRLVDFARALAASGASCAVPTLPGLAALRWDPRDVDAIGRVLDAATGAGSRPAVVVGFSHGASLALVAAARPAWSTSVAHVLGFGAFHSLARVFAGLRAAPLPSSPHDRDGFIYTRLVEVRRRAEGLALHAGVCDAADDLLRRYCDRASEAEKLRFYEEHLAPLAIDRRPDPIADATFAEISPEGKLTGLRASVGLVHDPDDLVVPVAEARALLAELRRVRPGGDHRLLETRLVRHVTAAGAAGPQEAWRLLRMVARLFERR